MAAVNCGMELHAKKCGIWPQVAANDLLCGGLLTKSCVLSVLKPFTFKGHNPLQIKALPLFSEIVCSLHKNITRYKAIHIDFVCISIMPEEQTDGFTVLQFDCFRKRGATIKKICIWVLAVKSR